MLLKRVNRQHFFECKGRCMFVSAPAIGPCDRANVGSVFAFGPQIVDEFVVWSDKKDRGERMAASKCIAYF